MNKNQSKISNREKLEGFAHSKLFCYLAPFAALTAYLLYMIATDHVYFSSGYYELQYLFTYDRGFMARGFIGEIISLFAKTVTPEIIKGVVNFGSVLLAAAASLCLGTVLDKTRDNPETFKTAALIIAVFCIAPFTFRIHFSEMKVDKFFWAASLFAIWLSNKKTGIWLVPLFCFVATLINPVFLAGAVFLVSIILLDECRRSGFARKNIIICAVSYIGMLAIGIYSIYKTANHGFASAEEMVAFYFSRYSEMPGDAKIDEMVNKQLVEFFHNGAAGLFEDVYAANAVGAGKLNNLLANGLLFSLPILAGLTAFWIKAIKEEKDKFTKFIFFLSNATLISLLFIPLLGWSPRFFVYSCINQIGMILYFLATKNETVIALTEKIKSFCKNNVVVSALVLTYFAVFFNKIFF